MGKVLYISSYRGLKKYANVSIFINISWVDNQHLKANSFHYKLDFWDDNYFLSFGSF